MVWAGFGVLLLIALGVLLTDCVGSMACLLLVFGNFSLYFCLLWIYVLIVLFICVRFVLVF